MKTIILLTVSLVLVLFPITVSSNSCSILSDLKKDQYVHVIFKGTPKGHIKGKVVSTDNSSCMLVISTTDEYRKYFVDVSSVAAIGTK